MSVQSEVTAAVAEWVHLLSAVVGNNPRGDIYDILARPDVAGELDLRLEQARARAEAGLNQVWAADAASPYRSSLESDVIRAYYEASAALRNSAIAAFQSVPQIEFVAGESRPGSNPAMDATRARARAVAGQTAAAVAHLGLRNELTVLVAQSRHAGEDALKSAAGTGLFKKWETRSGNPCDWCRELASQAAIPVDREFSHGGPFGHRRPPRVCLDLLCPPRHPRCRCRIILVRGGSPEAAGSVPEPGGPLFVPAQSVRAMPADRYQALHDFHAAALHELGQVLREHRQSGSG